MQLSEFGYDLPPERIATVPSRPRDSARLLHVATDAMRDYIVRDLPTLLRPDDLLVVNDTKVIPAQLIAWRGEAKIGITLDRRLDDGTWHVLLRNSKRVRQGDNLIIDAAFSAKVVKIEAGGGAILDFQADDFYAALARCGALALPPYITRPEGITEQDKSDYQTLFAAQEGAVAAPTAGLHFTPELLDALAARGVKMAKVTLHVGAGTFLPVRVERIEEHKMHAERGYITQATAQRINAAKAEGKRVIPIGTTALRLLESAATDEGVLEPFDSETNIFIYPGYRFKIADALFTNFHLPHSTLLMLVSAFAGTDRIKAAYAHAIAKGYRFYSYGDACLLEGIGSALD
ncbi:tRNA preQ1(34) S-adenosylmethionine ribosyltransferase-isomerase QueA [Acidocella sp.]|uniref:tRNA preQ1(34) S-adenosylmethionine ribosyltransferase-isomerase QueA n=1 Tax=Acidocella sp. TaxID=50710 RepID=UPI002613F6BE|nr:tRNA preQ1(34) S-adenosylmethionine ribosyltransferase-isomerase QueA [Acidocella sp.]